jgi:hypothetical protein
MTLTITVGRRVPCTWFKRGLQKISQMLSFQEQLWIMLGMSFKSAKKKTERKKESIKIVIEKYNEREDLNYMIEWLKVTIKGKEEDELEEFNEFKNFYKPFGSLFDKNKMLKKDVNISSMFKSKLINLETLERMYKNGMDDCSENNIANKLLEMGIMVDVNYIKDYETRENV